MRSKTMFPIRLRELMQEKEVNTLDIEKATGITNQAVSKWLLGKSVPSIIFLETLADYFDCTADFLIGRTDGY